MGRFMIFLAVSSLLLILVNIYLSKRYAKLLRDHKSVIPGTVVVYTLFLGLSLFLSSIFFQNWIYQHRILTLPVRYISAFYICMVIYSSLLFLAGDSLAFLGCLFKIPHKHYIFLSKIYAKGLLVPVVAVMITLYAFYNAVNFKVAEYEISIDKSSSASSIDAVMISDLHVGASIGKKEITEIKSMIEKLSPQIVFICGDLFDHASNEEIMKFSAETLGSIRSKYGTYFVTGNHEYYFGNMSEILSYFQGTGIRVLQDEMIIIDDFYLAGRKDIRERDRADLKKIIDGADKERPIIVLDHQPNAIDEAAENGVDLLLSGHTHNGQLFPFNYIVGLANHTHYGTVQQGTFTAIVSSGIGTWMFPVRTGSSSEIIRVKINFLKNRRFPIHN